MITDAAAISTNAFVRRYRLTKTDEFSSVFGFRKAIRGKLFMLHYQPRDVEASGARLGLVIGKKFLKSSVRRNLVKRILREQFRQQRLTLPACDLVVRLIVKPPCLDRKVIADEIGGLLKRLPKSISPRGEH